MSPDLRDLVVLNRVIHEPARMMILSILSAVDQTDFLFLLRETGLTRGNLSTHLARLEEAGYIRIEKTFRGKLPQTLCSITPQGTADFDEYRKKMHELLNKMAEDM